MSLTVLHSGDQKPLDALKEIMLMDQEKRMLLELHEVVKAFAFPHGSSVVERCTKENLYSVFLNATDRFPAEICFAYCQNGEWYLAYYPALNYHFCEEMDNLIEMRSFCKMHGIRMLSVMGASEWMARHGYRDPLNRQLIAEVRLATSFSDAIDMIRRAIDEDLETSVYAGGLLLTSMIRAIAKEARVMTSLDERSIKSLATKLHSEEVFSRATVRDIHWALSVQDRAMFGLPEDFDDRTFISLLEEVQDIYQDYRY